MNKKDMKMLGIENRRFYTQYGRSIDLSIGLIIGVLIDKFLLYISKGLTFFLPPFAVMLMTKGRVLKVIRFDRKFSKPVEYLLSHFINN